MDVQQRLLKSVIRSNWILFAAASMFGIAIAPPAFTRGIIFGGLIVSINFYLLNRSLKKAFSPQNIGYISVNRILLKYFIRFFVSGFIIFLLMYNNCVDPVGLIIGLSIVVASITVATMIEAKKLIFKEAI